MKQFCGIFEDNLLSSRKFLIRYYYKFHIEAFENQAKNNIFFVLSFGDISIIEIKLKLNNAAVYL